MKKAHRVHFIGICGVAMSAVATALWQKGYRVTGSDSGFFPPVSTHLTNLGIPYYPGSHPEKMIMGGVPDFVIVGNAVASQNSELVYACENNIKIKSYPEAVAEFLIAKKSIVCAGTYGKTTSAALLSHIFKHAREKPSYMFGGLAEDGSPAAAIDSGKWSVVEGDEYSTVKWDKKAKFFHYKPTHLMLTSVKWDHADLYPTEESYFGAFKKLIAAIPSNGKIVFCTDGRELRPLVMDARVSKENLTSYGSSKNALYKYKNLNQTSEGLVFDIVYHGKTYNIKSPLLGSYNAENITGCFAMAHSAGISPGEISDAIKSFSGLKRRMEKRYENKVTVMDDIAHSPEKAKSVLNNLRHIYEGLVIAVYEPNMGNRTLQSAPAYKDAFKDADIVVIPRLSKLKVNRANPKKAFDGKDLAEIIKKNHKEVYYFDDDDELVGFLARGRSRGDVIVFLGSHGWRGMIEETVKRLAGK
ncbi:MAG: Mur ligase family protein [Patescibacteria group bacterium]